MKSLSTLKFVDFPCVLMCLARLAWRGSFQYEHLLRNQCARWIVSKRATGHSVSYFFGTRRILFPSYVFAIFFSTCPDVWTCCCSSVMWALSYNVVWDLFFPAIVGKRMEVYITSSGRNTRSRCLH